jgi:hypothetical protein
MATTTTEPKVTGSVFRVPENQRSRQTRKQISLLAILLFGTWFTCGGTSAPPQVPPSDEKWTLVEDRGYHVSFLLPQVYEIEVSRDPPMRRYNCTFKRQIMVSVTFVDATTDAKRLAAYSRQVSNIDAIGAIAGRVSNERRSYLSGRPTRSFRFSFSFKNGDRGIWFAHAIGGDYAIFVQSTALGPASDIDLPAAVAEYQTAVSSSIRFG